MKFAMFQTPFMRPTRSPREVFDWAVDQAEACDRAGFTEYWIGEHATMTYESIRPFAPDCDPSPKVSNRIQAARGVVAHDVARWENEIGSVCEGFPTADRFWWPAISSVRPVSNPVPVNRCLSTGRFG